MFLGKGVLKIFSKFTGEHPCRSAISIKLQSNFIKITLRHWCSPVIRNFSWGELKKIESKIGNQSKKLNFYLKKKEWVLQAQLCWIRQKKSPISVLLTLPAPRRRCGGHNVPPCRFFERCILTGGALKLTLYDFSYNFLLNMWPVNFFWSVE